MDAEDMPRETHKKVVTIFAHPDDAEFVCGGTIARWVSEGHEVTYVVLTSGDKGGDDSTTPPEQLMTLRETEQRAACALLGVRSVSFLRLPDGELVPDLALRRDLVRLIRRLKPDIIITEDPTVHWVDRRSLNHPDHRAAGTVTLDAIFPAARNRNFFPELLEEGCEPHRVGEVYLAAPNAPDTWIDIGDHIEVKVAALRAHGSQVDDHDIETVYAQAREDALGGQGLAEYAEAFRYFDLR